MFSSQYTKSRLEKAKRIISHGGNPFSAIKEKGTLCNDAILIPEFKELFEDENSLNDCMNNEYMILGRVMLVRKMGKSGFFHVMDHSGQRLQAFASLETLGNNYPIFKNQLDIGDIVKVVGTPYVTRTGESTIKVTSMEILTKALQPLPEKFHGLEDKEIRYRKRYLDMIMNPVTRNTLVKRSNLINRIRTFMNTNSFLEVETPMLSPIPGGANARPFITHHNALDVDRYLRIAPELYLKRLVVGGLPFVYEIGKNFRNEGIDATHNPEFTSMEFYAAYTNYEYLMTFIETMFIDLVENIGLITAKVPYGDLNIDFSHWTKIPFRDALIQIGGIPENILDNREDIISYLQEHGISVKEGFSLGKLWEELFDEFVEEKLIDPTFITEYPVDISPLARRSENNPEVTERFELFIAGRELANGFNELNDPVDQYNRFKAQVDSKDVDDEAMHMDKDFIEALMHGLPPTAGAGIGIDRLIMLLTDSHSIRDVIAFPTMK